MSTTPQDPAPSAPDFPNLEALADGRINSSARIGEYIMLRSETKRILKMLADRPKGGGEEWRNQLCNCCGKPFKESNPGCEEKAHPAPPAPPDAAAVAIGEATKELQRLGYIHDDGQAEEVIAVLTRNLTGEANGAPHPNLEQTGMKLERGKERAT